LLHSQHRHQAGQHRCGGSAARITAVWHICLLFDHITLPLKHDRYPSSASSCSLILGLLWTLILRYEIKSGDDNASAMDDLLKWVRSKIPEYDIKNFTTG